MFTRSTTTLTICLLALCIGCGSSTSSNSDTKDDSPYQASEEEMPINYINETEESTDVERASIHINTMLGTWDRKNMDDFYATFSYPCSLNDEVIADKAGMKTIWETWIQENMEMQFSMFLDRILPKEDLENPDLILPDPIKTWLTEVLDDTHVAAILDLAAALSFTRIYLLLEKTDEGFSTTAIKTH